MPIVGLPVEGQALCAAVSIGGAPVTAAALAAARTRSVALPLKLCPTMASALADTALPKSTVRNWSVVLLVRQTFLGWMFCALITPSVESSLLAAKLAASDSEGDSSSMRSDAMSQPHTSTWRYGPAVAFTPQHQNCLAAPKPRRLKLSIRVLRPTASASGSMTTGTL